MSHVGLAALVARDYDAGEMSGVSCEKATAAIAREARFEKLVIHISGANAHALPFYRRLRFAECGRLSRQVTIDGRQDDEILMELFLSRAGCPWLKPVTAAGKAVTPYR